MESLPSLWPAHLAAVTLRPLLERVAHAWPGPMMATKTQQQQQRVEFHSVVCAARKCEIFIEANLPRDEFEAWQREMGWEFRPVLGWLCSEHAQRRIP